MKYSNDNSRIESSQASNLTPESGVSMPAFLWLATAFTLSQASLAGQGFFSPEGIAFLTAALLLAFITPLINRRYSASDSHLPHEKKRTVLVFVLVVMALCQIIQLSYWLLDNPFNQECPAAVLLPATALAVGGVIYSLRSPIGWWIQLIVFILLGLYYLPIAVIKTDVWVYQHESCAALLRGVNPYTIHVPDIFYAEGKTSSYFGEGVAENGIVKYGFPYLPLSLLLALPGYLAGDLRLSHLFAVAFAALLFTGLRPSAERALIGALFLWTPLVYFIILNCWTETLTVLMLGFLVFCIRKRVPWVPIACGLLLASKQYMFIIVPFLGMLFPLWQTTMKNRSSSQSLSSFIGLTLVSFCAVTLPFALWNPSEFIKNVVFMHLAQSFRQDALSFPALFYILGWGKISWLGFVVLPLSIAWYLLRSPRQPALFFASIASTGIFFFAFSKQAFVNYYYFALAAFCAAALLTLSPQHQQEKEDTAH